MKNPPRAMFWKDVKLGLRWSVLGYTTTLLQPHFTSLSRLKDLQSPCPHRSNAASLSSSCDTNAAGSTDHGCPGSVRPNSRSTQDLGVVQLSIVTLKNADWRQITSICKSRTEPIRCLLCLMADEQLPSVRIQSFASSGWQPLSINVYFASHLEPFPSHPRTGCQAIPDDFRANNEKQMLVQNPIPRAFLL
jgi:hypothetical protein